MKAKTVRPLGLYIHIPFCKSKCAYCDFYSLAGCEAKMDDYVAALTAHLAETAPMAAHHTVDTVYFGGGTPSYLGPERMRKLLQAVKRYYHVDKHAEITMEANPESVDKAMLTHLRRAGVNRLSLGVQSACDSELAALHRPHSFAQVKAAVDAARKAKLKNLSLDLIYGLPGQDPESWHNSVEEILALNPEHLSCYGLKVEEGTPLAGRVARGEQLPDDDAQADMYLWMVDRLAAAGYYQYEVSNFAKKGRESHHNLRYWLMREYIGFGPGAHSDFGGRRYSYLKDLEGYIDGVLKGGRIIEESNLIPQRERSGEYLMLGLRTSRGIEEWEYRREFFMNFDPIETKLEFYEAQGWAERKDRRWRLTPKGLLLSNQLIGELLEIQENASIETTLSKVRELKETGGVIAL
jgi:oxygen-independent coproporphyrinogen-3 oxidase